MTPEGVGTVSNVSWTTNRGDGTVVTPVAPLTTVGAVPTGVVQVNGSDGEPDISVTFTAEGQQLEARSMPHTVQDVVRRIEEIGASQADAALSTGRLDIGVDLRQATGSASLPLGNPGTLGALVGLTGLGSEGDGTSNATATATGGSFDVGFGIETGNVAVEDSRETVLLPEDDSLLRIDDLAATAPTNVNDLPARIGFLGVTADLTGLSLGSQGDDAAVTLGRVGGGSAPLPINTLLNEDGGLDPDQVDLTSNVTAGIAFTATEKALPGGAFATGPSPAATGSASVSWGPGGLPSVTFGTGYQELRVFDPVPAAFLSGNAVVTQGTGDAPDTVVVNLPTGADLYDALGVPAPASDTAPRTEVARRLVTAGLACQNVTLVDSDTLTCDGLAPNGEAGLPAGPVEMIVLGDPFALRNSIVEGLSATLASFDRLDGDNRAADGPGGTNLPEDQYTSTLPLVDLKPNQLAIERAALTTGLTNLAKAAAEDEANPVNSAGIPTSAYAPVSSAQELHGAIGGLVTGPGGSYGAQLGYDITDGDLGITVTASAPGGSTLPAPLRFSVEGPGQVSSEDTFPVGVTSTTTLAIDVDTETARPAVADETGTVSTASLGFAPGPLGNRKLTAGIGDFTVTGSGSTADLGVRVTTDYVPSAAALETTRTNARTSGRAAVASLNVGAATPLTYAADATDSSGGEGVDPPAPEAMEVKYAAEGLDGLATALEQAMDGAAPRNLDEETGAAISAPLIGSNLDAGAEVPKILRDLTSQLRNKFDLPAVTGAETAADLETALETATKGAVNATTGLDDVSSATAEVTCTGAECEPCDPPAEGEEPEPCTTEGPTAWETVSISVNLTGTSKTGKTPFDTGLPGLELRSDYEVDTATDWTLPITLELARGVGPRIRIDQGEALELNVAASLPSDGIKAIVGYLPAEITAATAAERSMDATIQIEPAVPEGETSTTYDLFQLYDGELTARPSFTDLGDAETGLTLDFNTLTEDSGTFDLSGNIDIPWSADDGFVDDVTYNEVQLDMGEVVDAIATPFDVVDPYLAPVRDVIDVLRTPIPVVSDLSELGGGGEVSLLSLLETLSAATQKPQLELAYRVIGLIDGVTAVVGAIAALKAKPGDEGVGLESLAEAGAVLRVDPSEVELYEKCTETVSTTKPATGTTAASTTKKSAPCPDTNFFETEKAKPAAGVPGQTTNGNRSGTRNVKQNMSRTTKGLTGSVPGFSLPFLEDPDQLMDLLTGEGEASYFRLDLGSLVAQVAYTKRFGPIMAGPVPIVPFVGGSISVEGRLAMGFDSRPQTLAVESLSNPGDVDGLIEAYGRFDGGDIITEGFYLDDLDADGVDVPEVKIVTTLEAGAGVSIGIVTAGLKGGITLTINLDINDPNDDGRLRTAEINTIFEGKPECVFDVSAELEAFISIFISIELLFTSLDYSFDLLRLGPYTLFEYGCPDLVPVLVVRDGNNLALTSGSRNGSSVTPVGDVSDDYEVRQFDTGGGAAGGGTTEYEVSAFGRVQRVVVTTPGDGYHVDIFESGIGTSIGEGRGVRPAVPADLLRRRWRGRGPDLVPSRRDLRRPAQAGGHRLLHERDLPDRRRVERHPGDRQRQRQRHRRRDSATTASTPGSATTWPPVAGTTT